MEPVNPAGANRVLGAPEGWDEAKDGPCGSLHVFAHVPHGGHLRMTSAWMPNQEELDALLAGHPVMLTVFGSMLPPMSIGVAAEPLYCATCSDRFAVYADGRVCKCPVEQSSESTSDA